MPSDWKEDALRHKYDPLPEEPRHRKKAKRRHVRSDHKHEYEKVAIDAGDWLVGKGKQYRIHTRCKICGRLQDFKGYVSEVPNGMALYELDGMMELLLTKELGDERLVRRAKE